MIGASLNQYRITAIIGAGEVGEVFRAPDTRLNREVAIKVLPTVKQPSIIGQSAEVWTS